MKSERKSYDNLATHTQCFGITQLLWKIWMLLNGLAPADAFSKNSAHFATHFTLNLTFICSKLVLQQATFCQRYTHSYEIRKSLWSWFDSRKCGFSWQKVDSITKALNPLKLPSLLPTHTHTQQNHFMHFMRMSNELFSNLGSSSVWLLLFYNANFAINICIWAISLRKISNSNSNLNCNCIKTHFTIYGMSTHTHPNTIFHTWKMVPSMAADAEWVIFSWTRKTGVSFNDKTFLDSIQFSVFIPMENPNTTTFFRRWCVQLAKTINNIQWFEAINLGERVKKKTTHTHTQNEKMVGAKSIYLWNRRLANHILTSSKLDQNKAIKIECIEDSWHQLQRTQSHAHTHSEWDQLFFRLDFTEHSNQTLVSHIWITNKCAT